MALIERSARGGFLILLAGVIAFAGYRAVVGALARTGGCGAEDPLAKAVVAFAAVGCVGLGHLAARYRARREPHPPTRHPSATAVLVHALLVLLFLVSVLVLGYETLALLGWRGAATITSYVRCAWTQAPITTAGVTLVVAFLVGHWLWFPNVEPEAT